MADEKDTEVEEFIDTSIREVADGDGTRVFDEEMLREPITVLGPREPVVVEPQPPAVEAIKKMQDERLGCVLVVRSN